MDLIVLGGFCWSYISFEWFFLSVVGHLIVIAGDPRPTSSSYLEKFWEVM